MEQNINLLSGLPSITRVYLSTKQMLQILGGWIILLFAVVIISYVFSESESTLNLLKTQRKNLNDQLVALSTETTVTLKELEQIAPKTANRETPTKKSGEFAGFANYLDALAKITPEGIGLENIVLNNMPAEIRLFGKAISDALIPEYLYNLNKNLVFAENKFTELTLQKTEKSRIVTFTLGTSKATKVENK